MLPGHTLPEEERSVLVSMKTAKFRKTRLAVLCGLAAAAAAVFSGAAVASADDGTESFEELASAVYFNNDGGDSPEAEEDPVFSATLEEKEFAYTGEEITPLPTVTFGEYVLTKDEEYELSYEDNISPGEARITVTGLNEYSDYSAECLFTIVPEDISDDRATIPSLNYTYTGRSIAPEPTLKINGRKLVKDTDYTVSYSDNKNTGSLKASVTLTGKGNYTGKTVRYFNINPNDLSDNRATIPYLNYTYSGKEITPQPTLKVNGIKLVKGTDYTVSYSNNINTGSLKAKITITGKGNFKGKTVRYFNINPNDLSDNHATIPKLNYEYIGSSIKPTPTLKVNGIKLVKGTDYTVSYKNCSKIGTGTVILTGKGNFKGTTSRKYNIIPAHGFYSIDGGIYYYDRDGNRCKNGWFQGYKFDKNGRMTDESAEFKATIDSYVASMLEKYDASNATKYQKLRTMFYHFEKNGYRYYKMMNPTFSDPKWEMEAADYVLKNRKGNCQRYSALFAYIARSVGYDAVAQYHYNTINASGVPNSIHAWTEVFDDKGTKYICDAEARIEFVNSGSRLANEVIFMTTDYDGPGKLVYYYKWAYD